jgi:hypothetical protein
MKKLVLVIFSLLSSLTLADTLMVEVVATEYEHRVQKVWTVEGDFTDRNQPEVNGNLRVTLWSGDLIMREYVVRNPLHLHSPLLQSGEEAEHEDHELTESLYHLRLPANGGVTRITIEVIDEEDHAMQKHAHSAPSAPVLDFTF